MIWYNQCSGMIWIVWVFFIIFVIQILYHLANPRIKLFVKYGVCLFDAQLFSAYYEESPKFCCTDKDVQPSLQNFSPFPSNTDNFCWMHISFFRCASISWFYVIRKSPERSQITPDHTRSSKNHELGTDIFSFWASPNNFLHCAFLHQAWACVF